MHGVGRINDIKSACWHPVTIPPVTSHKKVKLRRLELLMKLHLRATGCHLLYGITQCYLPPDISEHTPRQFSGKTTMFPSQLFELLFIGCIEELKSLKVLTC